MLRECSGKPVSNSNQFSAIKLKIELPGPELAGRISPISELKLRVAKVR
jgi:hypothetical protein